MKPGSLVLALEDAVQQLGVTVRRERGPFRSGYCLVDGTPMVVLNRRHPPESHQMALARALKQLPYDQIYLRPAVREALDRLWEITTEDPNVIGIDELE